MPWIGKRMLGVLEYVGAHPSCAVLEVVYEVSPRRPHTGMGSGMAMYHRGMESLQRCIDGGLVWKVLGTDRARVWLTAEGKACVVK